MAGKRRPHHTKPDGSDSESRGRTRRRPVEYARDTGYCKSSNQGEKRMTIRSEQRATELWDDEGGHAPSNTGNSPATDHPDNYVATNFQIPELKGISARNIQEHLELYKGYVKFSNHIQDRIRETPKDEAHAYELALLQRRFAYEYDGMKHHEAF